MSTKEWRVGTPRRRGTLAALSAASATVRKGREIHEPRANTNEGGRYQGGFSGLSGLSTPPCPNARFWESPRGQR